MLRDVPSAENRKLGVIEQPDDLEMVIFDNLRQLVTKNTHPVNFEEIGFYDFDTHDSLKIPKRKRLATNNARTIIFGMQLVGIPSYFKIFLTGNDFDP